MTPVVDDPQSNKNCEFANKENGEVANDKNDEVVDEENPEVGEESEDPETQIDQMQVYQSSATEATGLDTNSVKEQGITSWAGKVAIKGLHLPRQSSPPPRQSSLPPSQGSSLPPSSPSPEPRQTGPITPFSNGPYARRHKYTPQINAQRLNTDLQIEHISQQIRTFERIANRLNDLYDLRDGLLSKK